MSVGDDIHNSAIRRDIKLIRAESSSKKTLHEQLELANKKIIQALTAIDPASWSRYQTRLEKAKDVNNEIKLILQESNEEIYASLIDDLRNLAVYGVLVTIKDYNKALGSDIIKSNLSKNQIKALATNVLVNGKTVQQLTKKLTSDMQDKFASSIRHSVFQGEDIHKMISNIRGTKENGYKDGLFESTKRSATALVRTSFNSVMTEAKIMTIQDNMDVLEYVQHVSTLDSRTSDICKARDGLIWSLPDYEPVGHNIPFQQTPLHINCYHKDTEVMTDKGFKLFKDVDIKNDLMMSLNPKTKQVEWVKAIEKQEYLFNGNMKLYSSNWLQLCVTPDHRMFYEKRRGSIITRRNELTFSNQNDFENNLPENRIYVSSEHYSPHINNFKDYDMNLWIKFLGYYLSEGNIHYNSICISQEKEYSRKIMIKDLTKLFGKEHIGVWKGKIAIKHHGHIATWLKQFGYSFEKFVPDFIFELNSEQIKVFLDAYCLGDGNVRIFENKLGFKSESYSIFTSSRRMADDLVRLFILSGQACSLRKQSSAGTITKHNNGEYAQNYDVWTIRRKTSNSHSFKNIENIPYNDYVYDLTLEKNHTLLINYKGSIQWGSNCRSTIIAIPKKFSELKKKDQREIPEKKRASIDGEVPQSTTYETWLSGRPISEQKEILGPTKFRLFNEGKITMQDLLNEDGRPLLVSELLKEFD